MENVSVVPTWGTNTVSTSYGVPAESQMASGVGKKRRVTADWPGPAVRALLNEGAALTAIIMAKVERRDLIATILNEVEVRRT